MMIAMLFQILLQVVVPAALVVVLWTDRPASRGQWLLKLLALAAVLLFLVLTARWDFTSYYLRLAWPLLLIAAAARGFWRSSAPAAGSRSSSSAVSAVLGLGFLALSVLALRGHVAPGPALELSHPLRAGTYYVGGGGNARLINNHQVHEPQKFALDIVRLNAFGNRASGLLPDALERYAIFGDTVYSPCTGTVVLAVDGLADQRPPQRDRRNLAGNHVVLACSGAKVVLAHLKQGSVAVATGAGVREGDVLGQVGNSGNSSQPHLHLHAERGGGPDAILTGHGVPIRLNGRFLVRNSIFRE
mgnify:CR=1 FL=1